MGDGVTAGKKALNCYGAKTETRFYTTGIGFATPQAMSNGDDVLDNWEEIDEAGVCQ